jgi:hypothetical protein
VVCAENPPATGSHMPGAKECHTVAEWNTIHNALGRAVQGMLNKLQQENLRGGKAGAGGAGTGG